MEKKIIIIIYVFFCAGLGLSVAAEEGSVMGGKIRASVGGLPPAPPAEPTTQQETQTANSGQSLPSGATPQTGAGLTPSVGFPPYLLPQTTTHTQPAAPAIPNSNTPINAPDAQLLPAVSGTTTQDPAESEIQQAIEQYIINNSRNAGMLEIFDPQLSKNRKLNFMMIEGPSQKTGNMFRSIVKFQDVNSGDIVDLSFNMLPAANQINIINVGILRINGQEQSAVNANINPFAGVGIGVPAGNQPQSIFADPNMTNR